MSLNTNDQLLGRLAVHYKLITLESLREVVRDQGKGEGTQLLGRILIEKGYLTEAQLEKLLGAQKQILAKQAASKALEQHAPTPESTPGTVTQPGTPTSKAADLDRIHSILRDAVKLGASDIHIHSGAPLLIRRHGELETRGDRPLAAADCERMLRALLSPEQCQLLDDHGELDFAYTLEGVSRFRANVYRQQRGLDGTLRSIPPSPPSLEELGLPSVLAKLTGFHQGMVLITGPAGSGKSSTLAALLNIINEERREHILTIEDPIEVLHPSKRCLVNQRQIHNHTESFARALKGALREDPDVIAIGELRDLESISLALSAAETGHLVLATLHTGSTIRTIERMIGAFPPDQQGQTRTMLSESLRAVVSQRLVRTLAGEGRVPALEILMVTKAVGNLVRESKSFQIRSVLQTGASQGMCLLDTSLLQLVRAGTISNEEALRHCEDPKGFGG